MATVKICADIGAVELRHIIEMNMTDDEVVEFALELLADNRQLAIRKLQEIAAAA